MRYTITYRRAAWVRLHPWSTEEQFCTLVFGPNRRLFVELVRDPRTGAPLVRDAGIEELLAARYNGSFIWRRVSRVPHSHIKLVEVE